MPPNLEQLDIHEECMALSYYSQEYGTISCGDVTSTDCMNYCVFRKRNFDFDVLAKYIIDNNLMTKEHLLDIRFKHKL